MITFDFSKFTKPVKFYPYTSWVVDPIIEVNALDMSKLTYHEKDMVEFIDDLFKMASKLNLKKMGENGVIICSTREDNKTTIAMSNGNVTLYFGQYDWRYSIGFSAKHEFGDMYVIDLSDLKKLPKLK